MKKNIHRLNCLSLLNQHQTASTSDRWAVARFANYSALFEGRDPMEVFANFAHLLDPKNLLQPPLQKKRRKKRSAIHAGTFTNCKILSCFFPLFSWFTRRIFRSARAAQSSSPDPIWQTLSPAGKWSRSQERMSTAGPSPPVSSRQESWWRFHNSSEWKLMEGRDMRFVTIAIRACWGWTTVYFFKGPI